MVVAPLEKHSNNCGGTFRGGLLTEELQHYTKYTIYTIYTIYTQYRSCVDPFGTKLPFLGQLTQN